MLIIYPGAESDCSKTRRLFLGTLTCRSRESRFAGKQTDASKRRLAWWLGFVLLEDIGFFLQGCILSLFGVCGWVFSTADKALASR